MHDVITLTGHRSSGSEPRILERGGKDRVRHNNRNPVLRTDRDTGSTQTEVNNVSIQKASTEPLFEVTGLKKHFPVREQGIIRSLFRDRTSLKAVDDVSFTISDEEMVGLAGQSGCGKSTLGELMLGLQQPTEGEIRFNGEDITEFDKTEMKAFRNNCQVIFQDPYESLNPRYPIGRSVAEPLIIHGIGDPETRDALTMEILEDVGLRPPGQFIGKLPAELSGGERQRVCIARALVLDPDFVVADEPVSMLDVSIRIGILNLFKEIQKKRKFSMIYISHNLETIKYLTDRTMIMYLGNIVENAPTDELITDPAHPYTEALLAAVPHPDPERERQGSGLPGEVPDPVDLPAGCRFEPDCQYATQECLESEPELSHYHRDTAIGPREAACYHPRTEAE